MIERITFFVFLPIITFKVLDYALIYIRLQHINIKFSAAINKDATHPDVEAIVDRLIDKQDIETFSSLVRRCEKMTTSLADWGMAMIIILMTLIGLTTFFIFDATTGVSFSILISISTIILSAPSYYAGVIIARVNSHMA